MFLVAASESLSSSHITRFLGGRKGRTCYLRRDLTCSEDDRNQTSVHTQKFATPEESDFTLEGFSCLGRLRHGYCLGFKEICEQRNRMV